MVTTTADAGPGSLRQALLDANASYSPDSVVFAIPGSGPFTITPQSPLPAISDPLILDGSTQVGCPSYPCIKIDGSLLTSPITNGIVLHTSGSTIRGLFITKFNGFGVLLEGGASTNVIGGSGNARNVLSGNGVAGIRIEGYTTTGNTVAGNYIGTNSAGTAALGNGNSGIWLGDGTSGNTIGGTTAAARNVISGNTNYGVRLQGTTGNAVRGNFIGTNAAGTAAVANPAAGVLLVSESATNQTANNIVGGPATNARNVISGNGDGVSIVEDGANGNTVQGNLIGTAANATTPLPNTRRGVAIQSSASNNTIVGNTIANSGQDGIGIGTLSTGNALSANLIKASGGQGIDLGLNGVSPNDPGDVDSGPNRLQNTPVLATATVEPSTISISGTLSSTASSTFSLQFFSNATCDPSGFGEGEVYLGSSATSTNASGSASFGVTLARVVAPGSQITATATDSTGNTSEFARCVLATPPILDFQNHSWPSAHRLTLAPSATDPGISDASVDEHLFASGQSAWFKFAVQPGATAVIGLSGLAADYDLVLYRDVAAAYQSIESTQDIVHLSAEFAPETFSPETFSPETFSPETFSPETFSEDAFSPETFSPETFSPETFSPETFSPETFSPETFSPETFSPETFSPGEAVDPRTFTSAQMRSLMAISARPGLGTETIVRNTWDSTGDFYVRVLGRRGVFDPLTPFHVRVALHAGQGGAVLPIAGTSTLPVSSGSFRTIIVTDFSRFPATEAEKNTLRTRLAALAARPEVAGVLVDVGQDARVAAANAQADANLACPYAKNVVGSAIKDVITRYRASNPLEYVVLVGGDSVVPFFRHPDQAALANESNYVPPVLDASASQASLRLGYFLGQDRYGARVDVSRRDHTFPLPDLAVGRLIENTEDVLGLVDAYMATSNGVITPNTAPLVTGYDFLEDAARAVQTQLEAGTARSADVLIQPRNLPPTDAATAWSADQLRTKLLGPRHDVVFLAGHFSAVGALAADYTSRMSSLDIANSTANLENTIVFSAGCHAGYNIVDADAIPGVTQALDVPQAFARKRATLIAGSGYQYGDTDLLEYGERLYVEFSKQLRTGSGPVAIGKAHVAAKRAYLAGTAQMRGIHEKTMLQTTLFGLPMLRINMPGARIVPPADPSIVGALTPYASGPGATLGLKRADVTVTPTLTTRNVDLTSTVDGATLTATYLEGSGGVVANPAEPVLPLERRNVSAPATVLRGVGFRGGSFTDLSNIVPFTSAPATEIRGVHTPFLTEVLYPLRPWGSTSLEALAGGPTRLLVTPAQFVSGPISPRGTLRKFHDMRFRLFYNATVGSAALAGAPAIAGVTASVSGTNLVFATTVHGDPAAAVQEAWIVYTATTGPLAGQWRPLDLAPSGSDPRRWTASLPLAGQPAGDFRFMVQAASAVGLVTLDSNLGAFYVPGAVAPPPATPTSLALLAPPSSGKYGEPVAVSAILKSGATPLAGKPVTLRIGAEARTTLTNASGIASASLPMLQTPGPLELRASFVQTLEHRASAASSPFQLARQDTVLELTVEPHQSERFDLSSEGAIVQQVLELAIPRVVVSLRDASNKQRPLKEQTVFLTTETGSEQRTVAVITDFAGRAELPLDESFLRPFRRVNAAFGGTVELGDARLVTLDSDRYEPSRATSAVPPLPSPFAAAVGELRLDIDGSIPTPRAEFASLAFAATDQDGEGPHPPRGALLIDLRGPDFDFRSATIDSIHTYRSSSPLVDPTVRAEIEGRGVLDSGGTFYFRASATSGRFESSRTFEIRLWTTPAGPVFGPPNHVLRGTLVHGEIVIN
jgi:hypothetical protein